MERWTRLGEWTADRIAAFGGSWRFIGLFFSLLLTWIVWNTHTGDPFDPFPYILLNLILSCLAAIQAPIIMMSQRRQEVRDRELMRKEDGEIIEVLHDLSSIKASLQLLHQKLDLPPRPNRFW